MKIFKQIRFFCKSGILFPAFAIFPVFNVTAQDTLSYIKNPSFIIEIGAGPALANDICKPCGEEDNIPGYSIQAAAGYNSSRRFSYSAKIHIWISGTGSRDPKNSRMNLIAEFRFHPLRSSGLFFNAGAGYGNYFFTPDQGAIITSTGNTTLGSVTGNGFAFNAGTGYEIILSRKLSLIPAYNFYISYPGDLKANNNDIIYNSRPSKISELNLAIRYYAGM